MKAKPLQPLLDLALASSRQKYPSLPEFARTVYKYTDKTANGLTRCIVDFINFSGGQAERISSMGRVIDGRKKVTDVLGRQYTIGSTRYIPGSGTKGTADVSATMRSLSGAVISWKIEVKMKDRQSEVQKEYQADVERAGGVYSIVRSFDEFHNKYNELMGR